MRKTYTVEHVPAYGEIKVEIDFDHVNTYGDQIFSMEDFIKMQVDFWDGHKARLNDNKGDYIATYLKQLCQCCLRMGVDNNYNLEGIIRKFENLEGWARMDGRDGIWLLSFENIDLGVQEDYTITNYSS